MGHMFEGEAKSAIENKGKFNRVIKGLTRPRETQWHADNFGD